MGPRSRCFVRWIIASCLALGAGAARAGTAWGSPGATPGPEEPASPLSGFPYGALGLAASVAVLLIIVGITVVVALARRQRRG